MSRSWFQTIFSARMSALLVLGFSSGLPLLLIGQTLKLWMTELGIDLSIIGLFTLVGLPYFLKFVWSPLMDRYVPPFLGRRRGWILSFQLALIPAIAGMGWVNPLLSPWSMAGMAFLVAFLSASQDIAIDAYRRDLLPDHELGLGSGIAITGYRLGMYMAGGLAPIMADHIPWRLVYLSMGVAMGVGIMATLLAPRPEGDVAPPRSMREAVVEPFLDYFKRQSPFMILAFILLYKIGDSMASEMLYPFYYDIGFTKTQIGALAKSMGIGGTIAGGLLGGILMLKLGINRSLWVFGALQAVSTLCFSLLAQAGNNVPALALVISFEALTSGMGTSAFVAFMARLCNKRFTATQYALLTSFMAIPRIFMGAVTGLLAKTIGWQGFFVLCTLIALPGLLLLFRVAPWKQTEDADGT